MRIAFIGDSLTAGRPGSAYFEILRERLPEHELVNLGRGNDTVASLHRRIGGLHRRIGGLHRRIGGLHLDAEKGHPFDLAFLWVGVNDVVENPQWLVRLANALIGQPRARDLDEFRAYYRKTLDLLCRCAQHVIAVPPVLKGEDLGNPWNRDIEVLARVIEELTAGYEQVDYLALRAVFVQALAGKPISSYAPGHVRHLVMDILFRRRRSGSNPESAKLGLHLTIDGVHLNSAGAALVAEAFLKTIRRTICPTHTPALPAR
jgi:lysophospholipase L1-like esterase